MLTLYNHQKIALAYLRFNDSFALFMEQGTGKTIPALARILELVVNDQADRALIVAPKSALGAWERDMEKFSPEAQLFFDHRVELVNYDKVWRDDTYDKQYDVIVLDEAHCIKNRTSKRSAFLLKLATRAKYRYILTGTPISNGQLENIWSLYCFLNPYLMRGRVYSNIFKDYMTQVGKGTYTGSYAEFSQRYCILNQYHKPSSYINVKELQTLISRYCYRVKKSDCLDLPDKLPDEIVYVEQAEKALYKKLSTESALLEYEILADNPLSRLVKLRQLVSGHMKTKDDTLLFKCEKLTYLCELLEGYADDKKIVIFAEFKTSIEQIGRLCRKIGMSYVTLDGDQKDKTIWRQFQSDPTLRVIICQYQTASAGIDLYASDTIIYYEPTLRSQLLEQSRDRIHRSGQTHKCSYIHLLTKGTVEVSIYRALADYSDFSEKLFTEYLSTYRRTYT